MILPRRNIIRKALKTSIRPMMAKVRVLRAPSICLASPRDVIYLNPEKIIKTTAVIPERAIAQKTMF